jgi:hypothetical protein
LGRFINRDPSEESGGLNLYSFCLNNAVNGYDLLGMLTQEQSAYMNLSADEQARQELLYQTFSGNMGTDDPFNAQWDAFVSMSNRVATTASVPTNVAGQMVAYTSFGSSSAENIRARTNAMFAILDTIADLLSGGDVSLEKDDKGQIKIDSYTDKGVATVDAIGNAYSAITGNAAFGGAVGNLSAYDVSRGSPQTAGSLAGSVTYAKREGYNSLDNAGYAGAVEAKIRTIGDQYHREYGGEVYSYSSGDNTSYGYDNPRVGQIPEEKDGKTYFRAPNFSANYVPNYAIYEANYHSHNGSNTFSEFIDETGAPNGDVPLVTSSGKPLYLARSGGAFNNLIIVQVRRPTTQRSDKTWRSRTDTLLPKIKY